MGVEIENIGHNIVYKAPFFTFIFVVLLPDLNRLLIMFVNITFVIFQDGGSPPSLICKS